VLGAKVGTLFTLLSKDFLLLVMVAFVLATPLAALAMHKWLQNFAYQISLQWWVFVLAGAMALLIALVTVSFQAIKVAMANPVKSLRTE
jgi:putative ABC transport system permease protein